MADIDELIGIRENFDRAWTADQEDRERAQEDLRFLDGGPNQWPDSIRQAREKAGRPCITVNRLPGFVDQVEGDQRQNKPAIKIRAVDSDVDPELAKILSGIIRNIESVSEAEIAYDTAASSAVSCGRGFYRVLTVDSELSFDQDIVVKRIINPFSVSWDPGAQEYDLSDAGWIMVSEWISDDEFTRRYPDKVKTSFDQGDDYTIYWAAEGFVRIAELFRRVPYDKTLYLLSNGKTVSEVPDNLPPWVKVVKDKAITAWKVEWLTVSGSDILEEPQEWAGRYIPIIPVWGKELFVDGKRITRGVIRHAKDPQRMYNYWRSMATEGVAQTPKNPFLVTTKQIKGLEVLWDTANTSNRAYLPYNPDPNAPGSKPYKEQANTVQTGMLQEMSVAGEDLKATTGIYDASLGARSNENSGRAIIARQKEGDTATFAYIDNDARSRRHLGRILVDLIPRIYDASRIVRILGEDGKESFEKINWPTRDDQGNLSYINDLTQAMGKFDVVVTTGPSYTTQRMEAADFFMNYMKVDQAVAPMIRDLIMKNMDVNGADEFYERLKKALPPEFMDDEDRQKQQQKPQNPLDVIKVKKAEMEAKKEAAQATEAEARAKKAGAEAHGQELKNQQLFAALEKLIRDYIPQDQTGGNPGTIATGGA